MKTSRKRVFRFTAIVISFTVSFVAAEVLLRVLGYGLPERLHIVNLTEFNTLPGVYAPNQEVVDRAIPELPYVVRIDSLGYRGPSFPRIKQPGEFRILMAGDSFTYGEFVQEAETFPAQLEQVLERSCGTVRVINAGVPGSTIVGQHHMIRRGLQLDPDIVVLVFYENDVSDLGGRRTWWSSIEASARTPIRDAWFYPVLRQSAVAYLARRAVARIRASRRNRAAQTEARTSDHTSVNAPGQEPLRQTYEQAFQDVVRLLEGENIPLVFVAYPEYGSASGRESKEQMDWVVGLGQGVGVPTVDLLPVLRNATGNVDSLYLVPLDGHPNRRGYGVSAQAVADTLRAMKLVSCSRT